MPVERFVGLVFCVTCAVVFDELLWVEYVTSDTVSPHGFSWLWFVLLLFFPGSVVVFPDFVGQCTQSGVFVLLLGPLVLTCDGYAGGCVGDAHGGVFFVDVLTSGSAGAVGVPFEMFWFYVGDLRLGFWCYDHSHERGVSPFGWVVW